MNPFKWIAEQVRLSVWEGFRQATAEMTPDRPPADLDELRALLAPTPPALPAAEPETDTPVKRGRSR